MSNPMSNQTADSLMTKTANHLDDEQFSALLAGEELAGESQAVAQAHLASCAECLVEMERVAESMQSFSTLSLDWAERRSATMAPVRLSSQAAWVRPLAWASATAVLALGVMFGVRHDQSHPAVDVAQTPASSTGVSAKAPEVAVVAPLQPVRHLTREQQIAEDNRMLLAIRHELTRPDTFRMPASATRRSRATHAGNDSVND